MDLDGVVAEATRLGPWAYLATVGPGGKPHVVPVHPGWLDGTCWVFIDADSRKARDVAGQPAVTMHWTVGPATNFDGLFVEGTATVHTDEVTRRRLWTGVFTYDLDEHASIDDDGIAFMAIAPQRAVLLRDMGRAGRDEWRAGG